MSEGRGLFVVVEGGEGAGKSTLIAALDKHFAAMGERLIAVREPGGTAAGEQVRTLLHSPLTPWAEAFAFLLARAQLVNEVIEPTLASGAMVVCDRYEASTFAYQGHARGLDLATLRAANAAATGGLTPDLTVWLDVDPAAGLARKHGETETIRTGLETIEFHQRVRAGYAALMAEARPGSWLWIDATQPSLKVTAAVLDALAALRVSDTREH